MPVISVVTSVLASKSDWLSQAWESLQSQSLPPDWQWEWLLQVDGRGVLNFAPPADERVRLEANSRTLGPAMSRNVALGRVTGDLVKVLDGDDQLTPGQLGREIAVFDQFPTVGWTTSRVLDVLPDGSTLGFTGDPEPGVIPRTSVTQYWRATDHRASVHPATLCVRTELLLALGGWMALPSSEDTGLLLSLNTVADGFFLSEAGLLYRKWPKQLTAEAQHNDATERSRRFAVIDARIDALAAWGVAWPNA